MHDDDLEDFQSPPPFLQKKTSAKKKIAIKKAFIDDYDEDEEPVRNEAVATSLSNTNTNQMKQEVHNDYNGELDYYGDDQLFLDLTEEDDQLRIVSSSSYGIVC